ncbi:hypothetical protein BS17DRAFT_242360 [Gyrodon lividus]|nr:hypothetical protein BS17DRAFT_242360 [Gyrodon lividus]
MAFISSLSNASLDGPHSGLNADMLERLRNPLTSQLSLDDDPDLKAAVKLYLKLSHLQVDYNSAREVIMERIFLSSPLYCFRCIPPSCLCKFVRVPPMSPRIVSRHTNAIVLHCSHSRLY